MSDIAASGTLAEAIALLERLVAHDTESHRSNLALIDEVEAILAGHGVAVRRFPNASGDKATLLATFGPMTDGGVVLSGHTDTVSVEGQDWTGSPFALRQENGRLYGRGTCDMKGFAAIALAMAPAFLKAPLKRPIHLLLSYDEETTCLGPVDAIARFGLDLPRPAAVIVGEPTEMRVVDAHKGVACFNTVVTGFPVHSSKPHLGVNAVTVAAKLVLFLEELNAEMKRRGDPTGRFDPPYTTVHVGNIHGGTSRNITAGECRFEWEFRAVPGLDDAEIPERLARYARETLLPPLLAISDQAKIETRELVNVPGLAPDPGSAAESLALRLTASNRTETVPYGSEAGRFQRAGIATVLCGPGSIDQAHQPDEWIAIAELEKGIAFMRGLAAELAR